MKNESQVWITEIQVWGRVNENAHLGFVVSRFIAERVSWRRLVLFIYIWLCHSTFPMFHDVKHEIDGFCRYGEGGNQYLFILIRYHDAVFLLQLRSREIEYFMSCWRVSFWKRFWNKQLEPNQDQTDVNKSTLHQLSFDAPWLWIVHC